jgi:hypothetical protein
MRRVAGILAFVLVALGLGGSSTGSGFVVQTASKSHAELAIVEAYNGSRLAWLDPATLRPLKMASVALPGGGWSPVVSPAGQYVAVGGIGSTGVRVVDVRRMKVTAHVARRSSQRYLRPLAWPTRHRLLVLDYAQNAQGLPEALLAVDPVTKKVVGRTVRASTARAWMEWASAGRELVLLSEETERMGQARLVIFGSDGAILNAADVGIIAGLWPDGPPSSQLAHPGLAIDQVGRRAYVVDSQGLARVDLGTLDVSYVQLSRPLSVLSRIVGWLEPAAQAKLLSGFARQATWLGDGSLATSGAQYQGARSTPAGLQLVDTRTGSVRTLESRATAHLFSHGLLLAFGAGRDEQTQSEAGMGLAAFGPDGTRLWNALTSEPVWLVETAGGYAYVPTPETTFPSGIRVIDLVTGKVLRTTRGEMPTFIFRD